jgi:two-component system sensor histidine kinase YesM
MYKGQLVLSSCIDGNMLQLKVEDNGVGISTERLEYIKKQLNQNTNAFEEISTIDIQMTHDLFALKNVLTRIKMYYGNQAEFIIDSKENEGTTVIIRLPLSKCIEVQGGKPE